MTKRFNDAYLDAVLTQAFTEVAKSEIDSEPSLQELKEKYPCPKKMIRKIKNNQKEKRYNRPLAILYLQRVAVCLMAVITLSFSVLLTSTKVQAAVYETVVEWYDKYIVIYLDRTPDTPIENDPLEGKTFMDLEITYIPEGFELIMQFDDEGNRFYLYDDGNGNTINIQISNSDVLSVYNDNENVEFREDTINNNTAYISYSADENFGTIVWGNSKIAICVNGFVDEDTLIKISENIK